MKIIGYATVSSLGFEKQKNLIEQRQHLKYLHSIKAKPFPKIFVDGIPGKTKPEWITEGEYKKLLKKEEEPHGS